MSEKILDRHGSDGSFLIRASESTPGDFSLSVRDQGVARHYKITTVGGNLKLTGCLDQNFSSLGELVEYYIKTSKGRSHPLGKHDVEKMELAFSSPAVIRPGAMLPGQLIAMEMEAEAKRN